MANRAARPRLAASAAGGRFAVCPHCWHVNARIERLCGRCGADVHTLLQESGGLRMAAPVQSPVPVRVGQRLTRTQRAMVLGFVVLLGVAQLAVAFAPMWGGSRMPMPPEAAR